MTTDSLPDPQLEIAHVLFIDIVGYSTRPMADQHRLLDELQESVRRAAGQLQSADDDTIRLPTGDGMALVFRRDPVAPVRCGMQLARFLRENPRLEVRMGLHTGPVYLLKDINGNNNVAGPGINVAQRVMDCGDAGHLLLSQEMASLLAQVGHWPVHDLGICTVKHGQTVHLFNLFTDELGNAALPVKLRHSLSLAGQAKDTAAPPARPETPLGRVVLLYKRDSEPDNYVQQLLEIQLREQGYDVFVDRHLGVGMEWAREIDRQICTADAVIPILSAASVTSEMLDHEVHVAWEAAQTQRGLPRLLPVRVNFVDPLPDSLGAILNAIEYTLWVSPGDDERVLEALGSAIKVAPESVRPRMAPEKLESVGGAVPLDSRFYVVRPADEEFRTAVARRDSIVLIKGARQMGKTSLLARGLQQARQAGARVVRTDFQKLNSQHLESLDALFIWLGESIADQLDIDVLPDEVWKPRRGPSENFERYIRREILSSLSKPIIWGLDEVDRLFTCPFASEVFGLFRSWHNERALEPDGPWGNLTMVIAYATEAHLFISDVNQSPFNVGTRLALQDFTVEQVADLNGRHEAPLRGHAEVVQFSHLLGGHPYMVRRGLHEMATTGMDLRTFEEQADLDEGIYGDHLRRILVLLAKDSDLCDVVRGVLRGEPCPTPESFYRLRSAGVMGGTSSRDAHPRCPLYRRYLGRHLGYAG